MLRLAAQRAKDYVFDAFALAVLVASQVQAWTHADHPRARTAALVLVPAGALLFRRVAPRVVPFVTAAAAIAFSLAAPGAAYDTSTMFFVLLLAAWAAGSLLDRRAEALAFLAVLAAGWTVILRGPVPESEVLWVTLPLSISFVLSSAAARREERVRIAEARVSRSEDEARRAVEEERGRITRELHDVLAHSVSVMTVQASAVRRLLTPEQEREREALLSVEETGRQALAEMRRLVGIMRSNDEAPALRPQPGIGTLPQLLDQARESGLPVELTVEGTPVDLPAGVDLSAYRIVQEALTNTIRHGGKPDHVWVAVRWAGEDLEIEVENDGADAGDESGGHGLVGMRERVAMCGGELESGPRPGGGFRIAARLPVAGGA